MQEVTECLTHQYGVKEIVGFQSGYNGQLPRRAPAMGPGRNELMPLCKVEIRNPQSCIGTLAKESLKCVQIWGTASHLQYIHVVDTFRSICIWTHSMNHAPYPEGARGLAPALLARGAHFPPQA